MRVRLFALFGIACLSSAAPAAKPTEYQWTGFECRSQDGHIKRFNIDLAHEAYWEDGSAISRLAEVNETTIKLKTPNADLVNIVIYSEALDRRTLVLRETRFFVQRGVNQSLDYQCIKVPFIDFAAGRQF